MDRLEIGMRIAEIRCRKGESQEETAIAIDEKRENVRNWENGTRALKAETIIKLAQHFNVSTDYLLGLSEVKSTDTNLQSACEYTGLSEAAYNTLYRLREYCYGLHELNDFIATHGLYFADELYHIKEYVFTANCRLDRLTNETKKLSTEEAVNCRPVETLNEIRELERNLQAELYAFSETWREIPDSFGADNVLSELQELEFEIQSFLVKKTQEANDGEHQED